MSPDGILQQVLAPTNKRRWERGVPMPIEAYLDQHPDLRAQPEAIGDLIWNEILFRKNNGETPTPDEYLERFPHFESRIRAFFQADRTVQSSFRTVAFGMPGLLPSRHPPRESFPNVNGYEIEKELGRGGMGVVYQARQLSLKRRVALKMILATTCADSIVAARFRTEAEASARLKHPNIVQIHEVGELDGRPFLTLEFVEGGLTWPRASPGRAYSRKPRGRPPPGRLLLGPSITCTNAASFTAT